jgi:hypothetical protein
MEMTVAGGGQSVNTHYELDNGRVLAATSGENTSLYLYGLNCFGEGEEAQKPFSWENHF